MTKNEIKKALYREKPMAKETDVVSKDNLTGQKPYSVYATMLGDGSIHKFVINHSEMGENRFDTHVPAQLLIRWLV